MALPAAREYPEGRMRVDRPIRDEGMRVTMRVGPWMDGPDGVPLVGALGVIVDDAVGMEVHHHRPPGTHSVTTELSVDVVVPPPWAGPRLLATSRLVGSGPADGVSRAEIRSGDGQVIAIASGRSRFVPAEGVHADAAVLERDPPPQLPAPDHASLLEAFGITDLARALTVDPDLPPEIARLHLGSPIPAQRPSAEPPAVARAGGSIGLAGAATASQRTAAAGLTGGGPAGAGTALAAAMPRGASVASVAVPPAMAFGNGSGTMHGGLLFTCSDLAAAALAGALTTAPAADYTTSVRLSLLRPALLTAPVVFSASVLHRGRALSVYRVTSHGPAGKPYTVATITRASRRDPEN